MTQNPVSRTPRTDAALERFPEEGAFVIFPLMRQLETELSTALSENGQLRKQLEEARACIRDAFAWPGPTADVGMDPWKAFHIWKEKHAAAIQAAREGK